LLALLRHTHTHTHTRRRLVPLSAPGHGVKRTRLLTDAPVPTTAELIAMDQVCVYIHT
jgi:hypothetical protein